MASDSLLDFTQRGWGVLPGVFLVIGLVLTPGTSTGQDARTVSLLPPDAVPSALLHLPGSLGQEAGVEPAAQVLPTVAGLYRMHAGVLEAEADGEELLAESRLAQVLAQLQALVDRPEYVADERFAELYQTVLTEWERYYGPSDTTAAAYAEIFQVRAQTFAALNELEDPLQEPADGLTGLPNAATVAATEVPMTINRAVTTAMEVLLEKRPETLANWASRAHTWFPLIEKVFAEEGIPDELKYLAMIESGLRPSVRSRAAAVGMWQFVAATGRHYGLVVDGWVDERMDPEKATRAAAKHLKDLYELHGDWYVAMSGYNCSPRCLNRARRNARNRGVENPDFWDMYPFLPRETRNYIPQYIATSIMLSNPEAYGIEEKEPGQPFAYELIPVRGSLAVRDVAVMAGVSAAEVDELNPALRRGYLPPSARPYPLRLPVGTSERFLDAYASLPAEALRPPGEHIVRSGDTLSEIAATYGVSVSRLRSDNRLRGSLIHPGQRLIVPVSDYSLPIAEAVAEAEPVSVAYGTMNRKPIHSLEAVTLAQEPTSGPGEQQTQAVRNPAPPPAPSGTRIAYTVRSGDTLSEIADAHGVGLSRVRAWNGISGSRIRVGQRLTLYVDPSRVAASAPPSARTYAVRAGDTLSEIAENHGVSVTSLRQWNGITGSRIRVGQELTINGTHSRTHQVRQGDTLIGIARAYNVTVSELRRWNRLDSDRIYPGAELRVAAPD